MHKPTILLVEDDHKTESAVVEALEKDYKVEVVTNGEEAVKVLDKKHPDLLIIDYDLKKKDGLQVFRELNPNQKTIMLSASGSIPLSVSAAKLGVAEFLHKPVQPEILKKAAAQYAVGYEEKIFWPEGGGWLKGGSPAVKEMLAQVKRALFERKDIILFGEEGIDLEMAAELIHLNSPRRERKSLKIDLSSFRKEGMESHFWAVIKEALALSDEEGRAGTIYLDNFEKLDEHFKFTLLTFLEERKGNLDRSVRVVIGIRDRLEFQKLNVKNYAWLEVTPLRKRKEDLAALINLYLRQHARRYNKAVSGLSAEALEFLAAYDYPGNYAELNSLIEGAVMHSRGASLEFKELALTLKELTSVVLKKEEGATLDEARRAFEKSLYQILLQKSEGELGELARFLDIPKTALAQRLEELAGRPGY